MSHITIYYFRAPLLFFGWSLVFFTGSAQAELDCRDILEGDLYSQPTYVSGTPNPTVLHNPHFQVVENRKQDGSTIYGTLYLIRYVERPSSYSRRGLEEEIGILQYVVHGDFLRIVSRRSQGDAYFSNLSMTDELLNMYSNIRKISFKLGEANQGRAMDMSFEKMQEIVSNPSLAHQLHPVYGSMWMRGFVVERASIFTVGNQHSLLTVLKRRENH